MNTSKKVVSKIQPCGLVAVSKKGYTQKKLHIYDQGQKNSISGIRATIFGATGYIGQYVGQEIGAIGSQLIYPFRSQTKRPAWYTFDLKLTGDLGYSHLIPYFDFSKDEAIERAIADSNVVINLIGTNDGYNDNETHHHANVTLARKIAKIAKKKDVIRYIHFSAAGADPQSPSKFLRTKWLGEQVTRDEFPEATIMRPCTIYQGRLEDRMFKFHQWNNYLWLVDDGQAKRQPIHVSDVGKCVLNALKLEESAGQTYELGGPVVHSLHEIYEMTLAKAELIPKIVSVPFWFYHNIMNMMPHGDTFSLEHALYEKTDLVVGKDAKTCEDLYIKPASWAHNLKYNVKWYRPTHYGPQTLQDELK